MIVADDEIDFRIPFPVEFAIGRTPLSAQATNKVAKEDWKEVVRKCASDKIAEVREQYFLDDRALMATIYYFPPTKMQGDVDNIVKPILDAMTHIVYLNDRHIERVVVQKFEPGLAWIFLRLPRHLKQPLKWTSQLYTFASMMTLLGGKCCEHQCYRD